MSIPSDKYWIDLDDMKYENIIPSSTWDDPLDQKLTGTITVAQLDEIYYSAILALNSRQFGTKTLAQEIEKLYHIARMSCQNV